MTGKVKKQQAWEEAKKKYRLSNTTVQMVRELGLNPHILGKIANHKQEPWKEPLLILSARYTRKDSNHRGCHRDLIPIPSNPSYFFGRAPLSLQ